MSKRDFNVEGITLRQKLGYLLIFVFFLISVYFVFFRNDGDTLNPNVTRLVMGHWFLEAGVRDGFAEVARDFEKMKAEEGVDVNVVQSTIPVRGYKQWFTTQLIGGNPADLLFVHWQSRGSFVNRYFKPLTTYVAEKNPFNEGTPLEDYSWRDSMAGEMEDGLDPVFADYYKVGFTFPVFRIYANLDLLEAATGERKMPSTLAEWLEDCRKIREYGERQGENYIPIGCQGKNKGTIARFLLYYFNQLTGNYNDDSLEGEVSTGTLLQRLIDNPKDRKRLLSVGGLMSILGNYFDDGFISMDREQTLFLFFSGKTGFYFSGSWELGAMLAESSFDVGVAPLPLVGKSGTPFSHYFTGPATESGVSANGGFGIPRAGENFELALEFLQFMTSYEENQKITAHCYWPPAVKKARFEGSLTNLIPRLEGHNEVPLPFDAAMGQMSGLSSVTKFYSDIETLIIDDIPRKKVPEYLFERLKKRKDLLVSEMNEQITSYHRSNIAREKDRTRNAVGLLRDSSADEERELLNFSRRLSEESFFSSSGSGKIGSYLRMKDYRDQAERL